jgi:hypothetical protein
VQWLQNHAARVIEGNFDYVNTRGIELVVKLGWMTIKERFIYFQVLLIFKCIHGLAPSYLNNNVIFEFEIAKTNTRSHDMNLYIPIPDNEFHKKMLFYRGAKSWNTLPNFLKDCTNVATFKMLLKRHIKSIRTLV